MEEQEHRGMQPIEQQVALSNTGSLPVFTPAEHQESARVRIADGAPKRPYDYADGPSAPFAAYIKAQTRFLEEQTFFLRHMGNATGEDYTKLLDRYSLEQSIFIHAQTALLQATGII
jgi:hypothetical protein